MMYNMYKKGYAKFTRAYGGITLLLTRITCQALFANKALSDASTASVAESSPGSVTLQFSN